MKIEELKKTKRYIQYNDYAQAVLTVPKAWCVRFNLTPTELMVFEEIHQATHFWQLHCYCASRTSLCVIVNASPPTIDKALLSLTNKGFISRSKAPIKTQRGGERQNICYISLLPKDIRANDKTIEEILERNVVQLEEMGRIKK